MGLAASQARLLTITSRMSNNELRQQRIAMDKMRLASDSDTVSQKYSEALNNQTLKFNDKDFTYGDLVAAGYSVMKTSSGVISSDGVYRGEEVAMPTCKRPEEIRAEEPAILSQGGGQSTTTTVMQTLPSHITGADIIGDSGEIENDYDYIIAAFNTVTSTYVEKDTGTIKNKAQNYDYEKTTAQRNAYWVEMGAPMLNNLASKLESTKPEVAQKIRSACSRITTNLDSLANKTGTNANRSAMNIYKSTNSEVIIVKNSLFSSGILEELKKTSYAADEYNNNGKKVPTNKTQTSTGLTDEQKTAYQNWQNEIKESEKAWAEYDSYVEAKAAAENPTSEQQELANQLKSSNDFLIQGLLSGYLCLVNSAGDMVSLTSDTKFTTEYDKSDDAAAEAEYNSQMAKINRKEKLLDNQAKRLDTEYNALNIELQSIQSIIQTHATKDFELFS